MTTPKNDINIIRDALIECSQGLTKSQRAKVNEALDALFRLFAFVNSTEIASGLRVDIDQVKHRVEESLKSPVPSSYSEPISKKEYLRRQRKVPVGDSPSGDGDILDILKP